ncbi:hypothetical protein C2845_PM02G11320 [Panicum miliaceum]|uniref:Uncharacterized protein n=1 Tax=Panicum miliaceum TaxID=4540 RepID=A0A3L6SBW7_PANMI|nr:hypothetical protein C2845_PM02G11320 [Panicum miliaceum]
MRVTATASPPRHAQARRQRCLPPLPRFIRRPPRRFATSPAHWPACLHGPSAVAAAGFPADDDDGDHPKLFFAPDVVSSPAGYSFSAWMPGGQVVKLPCAAGVLPEGALVIPVMRPLHGLVLHRCWPPPAGAGYFVCNPSTGALLPPLDTRVPRRMAEREYNPGTFYGLGYSASAGEYKAVGLFCLCEVLVLGASPHWRPAAGRLLLEHRGARVPGRCHALPLRRRVHHHLRRPRRDLWVTAAGAGAGARARSSQSYGAGRASGA